MQCCFGSNRAIQGSSSEEIHHEVGLESLQSRGCFKKLCQFYKILKSTSPQYLFNLIPTKLRAQNARYCDNIALLKINHNYSRTYFFPSSTIE